MTIQQFESVGGPFGKGFVFYGSAKMGLGYVEVHVT